MRPQNQKSMEKRGGFATPTGKCGKCGEKEATDGGPDPFQLLEGLEQIRRRAMGGKLERKRSSEKFIGSKLMSCSAL